MKLNWNTVRAEHAQAACELLAKQRPKSPRGLCVVYRGTVLPAKDVQRLAYLLANGLDHGTKFKFTSGDGTINLLKRLGFEAYRTATPPEQAS
jgi:hypothetical protein